MLVNEEECYGMLPQNVLNMSTQRLNNVDKSLHRLWLQMEQDLPKLGVVPQRKDTSNTKGSNNSRGGKRLGMCHSPIYLQEKERD